MEIYTEKIGSKSMGIVPKKNFIQEKSEQEESIFTKNKTLFAIGIAGGIAVGLGAAFVLPKLLKNSSLYPKKSLKEFIQDIIKKRGKGHTISLSELGAAKSAKSQKLPTQISSQGTGAKAAAALNSEEKAFYESVLKEFDDLHPEKVTTYPETGSYYSKTHINHASSEIAYSEKLVFDTNRITKHFEQKERTFKYILGKRELFCTPSGTFNGDKALIEEYRAFLNGVTPNAANFKEFMKYKDLEYIKNKGIWELETKAEMISREKGEIIKAQEKLRHKRRQIDYEHLWRPYSTKQYYRIVGKEELLKMLKGEKIVSPRYLQYGRMQTDITTNPYYHGIFYGEQKFRLAFKRVNYDGSGNSSFASRISEWAPEKQHYHLNGTYTKDDVKLDEIMFWDGSDWVSVQKLL